MVFLLFYSVEEQEAFLDKSKKVIGECCALDLEHQRDLALLKKTEEKFTKDENESSPEEVILILLNFEN